MQNDNSQTTKRPRKDEISSVLKLLRIEAEKNRKFAKRNIMYAEVCLEHAKTLRGFADKQNRTAERYERVATWIESL